MHIVAQKKFNKIHSSRTHWVPFVSKTICDTLQQNREQVAQAYFEKWIIEVVIGVSKNKSSADFEILGFFFAYTIICSLSPPCNF